ncbi:MAG TPA: ABC transporter ATP-binding protein [Nitrososphaerales archaeon]|nr:ABC transporter ATP-binding protein [Nitrososphaerales archaeon]
MTEAAVAVQGLVKRYGDLKAVDGITFETQRGEIFALLGPNGAGKTTTVEILECIRHQTAGKVLVLGSDVSDKNAVRKLKSRIGVLPQEFRTLERLTVRENLQFFAGMYDEHADIGGLLEVVGLKDKARVRFSNLSGGLKQRLGIAAALVNDPELIFLDEPTTGLDPEARRETWKVIQDLKAKGKTVILTTHYMEEAEKLADHIGIIVKGKIAALDTPANLVKAYGGGNVAVFRNGGDTAFGTLRRFFGNVSMEGSDVLLPVENSKDIQVALTALLERGVQPDLALKSGTIEDVFLRLSGVRMTEAGDAR